MRSLNYLKVEGHESLIRDPQTKAILSVDDKEYENYVLKKKAAVEHHLVLKNHGEEIENIKRDLSEIKNLLIKIIEER